MSDTIELVREGQHTFSARAVSPKSPGMYILEVSPPLTGDEDNRLYLSRAMWVAVEKFHTEYPTYCLYGMMPTMRGAIAHLCPLLLITLSGVLGMQMQ